MPCGQCDMTYRAAMARSELISKLCKLLADRSKIVQQHMDRLLQLGLAGKLGGHYGQALDCGAHESGQVRILRGWSTTLGEDCLADTLQEFLRRTDGKFRVRTCCFLQAA